MSEFNTFIPGAPKGYTVNAGAQTLLLTLEKNTVPSVLVITNNSASTPIYLGFTSDTSTVGNAQVNHGITIFPQNSFEFIEAVPVSCRVWATCASGTADVGVQR